MVWGVAFGGSKARDALERESAHLFLSGNVCRTMCLHRSQCVFSAADPPKISSPLGNFAGLSTRRSALLGAGRDVSPRHPIIQCIWSRRERMPRRGIPTD
jgi:hypothetical protein